MAGTWERSLFNHSKTAQTTNNTTQGNVHQLGEIREHVCYKSPKQIDQHRREIRLSVGNGKSKSTSKDTYVANLRPGEFGYKIASNLSMARRSEDDEPSK